MIPIIKIIESYITGDKIYLKIKSELGEFFVALWLTN